MAQETLNGDDVMKGAKAVFSAVKPWLVVEAPKADAAIQFYKTAFGAVEVNRLNHPKRKAEQEIPLVLFAELKLGSCSIVVSDLTKDSFDTVKSPVTSSVFCLETEDVEAAVKKAIAAGGTDVGEITEGEDTCSGCRVGKVEDPYGNVWMICPPTVKKSDDVVA